MPHPDGLQSNPNRQVFPVGFAAALSLFGDLTLFAALVTHLNETGLTLAQVGILLSIHRLVRIPGNPMAGYLQNRLGRRVPFLIGMVLAVASTVAYGLAIGFWPFLASRIAWGMAWALINVGGMTMVLDLSHQGNRGRLAGLYNAWIWIGYAIGPLVGSLLVDALSFRTGMLILAGFTLIGLLSTVILLPDPRPPGMALHRSISKPNFNRLWFRLTKFSWASRPALTAMVLFGITQFAGDGILLSTLTMLLTRHFGLSIRLGSVLLGAASVSGGLLALRSVLAAWVSLQAGSLADRRLGRLAIIAAGLVIGMGGFTILAFSRSFGSILLGVVLGAVSSGAILVALPAYLGDHTPPEKLGNVMGTFALAGDIGSASGPALAFAVAPLIGLPWVYGLCILVFGIGLASLSVGRNSISTGLDVINHI